jgi:hypothetical protein
MSGRGQGTGNGSLGANVRFNAAAPPISPETPDCDLSSPEMANNARVAMNQGKLGFFDLGQVYPVDEMIQVGDIIVRTTIGVSNQLKLDYPEFYRQVSGDAIGDVTIELARAAIKPKSGKLLEIVWEIVAPTSSAFKTYTVSFDAPAAPCDRLPLAHCRILAQYITTRFCQCYREATEAVDAADAARDEIWNQLGKDAHCVIKRMCIDASKYRFVPPLNQVAGWAQLRTEVMNNLMRVTQSQAYPNDPWLKAVRALLSKYSNTETKRDALRAILDDKTPAYNLINLSECFGKRAAVYVRIKTKPSGSAGGKANSYNDGLSIPTVNGAGIGTIEHNAGGNRQDQKAVQTFGPFKSTWDKVENTGLVDGSKDMPKHIFMDKNENGTNQASLAYDVLHTLMSGRNVVLFATGNSGSGKSHSLIGSTVSGNNHDGCLQLILRRFDKRCRLVCAFEEVPSGTFKDTDMTGCIIPLFNKVEVAKTLSNIPQIKILSGRLMEDKQPGAIRGFDAIIEKIAELQGVRVKQLRVRSTSNNPQSSRSHTYYMIAVNCRQGESDRGTLTVIDLGGTERPLQMFGQYTAELNLPGNNSLKANLKKEGWIGETDEASISRIRAKCSSSLDQFMNFVPIETEKEDAICLSDVVSAYAHFLQGTPPAADDRSSSPISGYSYAINRVARLVCDGMKEAKAKNIQLDAAIFYPTTNGKSVFKTAKVNENSIDYFSMFHIAALVKEGEYINKSLQGVQEYMVGGKITSPTLTHQILGSLSAERPTRAVMLFTADPASPYSLHDGLQFAHAVASTAALWGPPPTA